MRSGKLVEIRDILYRRLESCASCNALVAASVVLGLLLYSDSGEHQVTLCLVSVLATRWCCYWEEEGVVVCSGFSIPRLLVPARLHFHPLLEL